MENVKLGKWKKVKGEEFSAKLTATHKGKVVEVEVNEFREDLTREALNVATDIREALVILGRLCK